MTTNRDWVDQMFSYAEYRDIRETFKSLSSDGPQHSHKLDAGWNRRSPNTRVTTHTDKTYQPPERKQGSTYPTWSLSDRRERPSPQLSTCDYIDLLSQRQTRKA